MHLLPRTHPTGRWHRRRHRPRRELVRLAVLAALAGSVMRSVEPR